MSDKWDNTSHQPEALSSQSSIRQDGPSSRGVSEKGYVFSSSSDPTLVCRMINYDLTNDTARFLDCLGHVNSSQHQSQVTGLSLWSQMNPHEAEIRQPARTRNGFLSTVPCLAEQTVDSETGVEDIILRRSEMKDTVSGQHTDKAQLLTVENPQPTFSC